MLARGNVAGGGLAVVAACASIAGSQTANAQTYSRGCGTYNNAVTYVDYQPAQYAPVYTSRQVVYTVPARRTYVEQVPVREVVRYVSQPVRTRTGYVRPQHDYYPRAVFYSSGHYGGHRSGYGYRSGYGRSHYGSHYARRSRHHRSRSFHLDIGRLHIGVRRGHHRGISVRLGH